MVKPGATKYEKSLLMVRLALILAILAIVRYGNHIAPAPEPVHESVPCDIDPLEYLGDPDSFDEDEEEEKGIIPMRMEIIDRLAAF